MLGIKDFGIGFLDRKLTKKDTKLQPAVQSTKPQADVSALPAQRPALVVGSPLATLPPVFAMPSPTSTVLQNKIQKANTDTQVNEVIMHYNYGRRYYWRKVLRKKITVKKKSKSSFLNINKPRDNKHIKQNLPALAGPNDSGLYQRLTSNRKQLTHVQKIGVPSKSLKYSYLI